MERIKDTEKAYLAGLIDGEGYIGLTKTKIKYKANPKFNIAIRNHLLIASTNNQVINWLIIKFGGKTQSAIINQRSKPIIKWWINRQDLQLELLKEVFPYLIIKKEQARLMIEWLEMRLIHRKNKYYTDEDWSYIEKFKILNKRGVK